MNSLNDISLARNGFGCMGRGCNQLNSGPLHLWILTINDSLGICSGVNLIICTQDWPYLRNLEMSRRMQGEEQHFSRFRKQQMGRFSMQEKVLLDSIFSANQQAGSLLYWIEALETIS